MPTDTRPRIAIIGAGFGGICMAIQLEAAGIHSFTVFERENDLGGVWRDNTYPGAACDIPSHLYSLSFEPKPDWSRRFPAQAEIKDYLQHCVHKYAVAPHIRFGTGIDSATYDEDRSLWVLITEGGQGFEAEAVVSACGQLRIPAYPRLPGQESFTGTAFHSARWDHELDLAGKSVAVIGTGATAIQIVPAIVDSVRELKLFQRTPPYLVPRKDRPYPRWEQRLYRRLPPLQKMSRLATFLTFESRILAFGYAPRMMRAFEAGFRRDLRKHFADPDMIRALTPDYRMGCKRVLISSEYFTALKRANLELVTDDIERIAPGGIRTADGTVRDVDVIVYATGFRAGDFLTPMRVTGAGGREINDVWRGGARAHLGITVSGFPNFFLLYGPNTNLGHNSILYMVESQVAYVMDAIRHLQRPGVRSLDVRSSAQERWDAWVQHQLRHTVFDAGCDSWYINDAGRITNNWPSSVLEYRRLTRRLVASEYAVEKSGESRGTHAGAPAP